MYKKVTAEELIIAINSGWNPTWFAIENDELIVDLCIDFRLQDGKILFLSVQEENLDKLFELSNQVTELALQAWNKSILNCRIGLEEEIVRSTQVRDIYRKVQWKEGHVYRFVDEEDNNYESWFICVETDKDDIDYVYLKELPEKQFKDIYNYKTPVLAKKVVLSHTKVIDEGYQPDKTFI